MNGKAAPKIAPKSAPKSAMYLGAGLGERMRPLTNDRPKPLIMVAGRPMIDTALDNLAANGVELVVINLHYRGEMIRDHLRARTHPQIVYSDETDMLLGPGGGVRKALPLLGDAPFFVHNCDSFWREQSAHTLQRMAQAFDASTMDALLMVTPLANAVSFEGPGDYFMSASGALRRNTAGAAAPYAYCGVQICHPRLFADAPQGAFSTVRLWDNAERAGRLFGLRHDHTWFHVGTPEAVKLTEQILAGR